MIKIISKSSGWLYISLVKRLLFLMPADFVHEMMIKSGNVLQKAPFIRVLFKKTLAFSDPMIEVTYKSLHYSNPLGLSAGLDKDGKIVTLVEAIGFGFMEIGSVTFNPYKGNKKPWYTRLPKSQSIIVNSGLRSEGAHSVIKRLKMYDRKKLKSFPFNVSIAKTNSPDTCTLDEGVEDYIQSLRAWEKSKLADVYTINISCPNTFGGEPFSNPKALEALLVEVDKLKIQKPLFVKMPIDKTWQDTKKLLDVCAKHSVDGITLGNLYKDRKTVKLKEKCDSSIAGNFSGKPCQETSNRLLAKMYEFYHDRFIFSGVGGVFNVEDAYKKIRLGATFVEMITGLIFNGPTVVGRINEELVELLKRDGFTHISEAVGVDVKKKGIKI